MDQEDIDEPPSFYDLVALPEFAHELREEAQQALDDNGGIFTSNALQSMKKMDSFLKETLRLYPATMGRFSVTRTLGKANLDIASFQRKVLKPFALPNGQLIPQGVTIEVPAVGVNADSEVFERAEDFDPLRFYNLREQAKQRGSVEGAAQNQFVSVSQNSLTFGYGRHACPGRFFAANEIKMILANAIMGWEFKMVEGISERYPNVEFAHMVCYHPVQRIIFMLTHIIFSLFPTFPRSCFAERYKLSCLARFHMLLLCKYQCI